MKPLFSDTVSVDSPLTSDKKGPHIRLTQSELAGMHPCIQTCDPHISSLAMGLTFYQVIANIADKVDGATKLKTPSICIRTDFHTAMGQVGSWNISKNKSSRIQSADVLLCIHGSKQSLIVPITTTTCTFMVWTVCVDCCKMNTLSSLGLPLRHGCP